MLPAEAKLRAAVAAKGLNYVGTRGNTSAPVCICGEAPGADEDQAGVPFVGSSGRELDRMVLDAALSPSDCWFTNPYKVRPPDNELPRLPELGIPTELFHEQFVEELRVYRPTIIVAAGATSLGYLCPETLSKKEKKAQIGKYRGSLLRSSLLDWPHYVVGMYHPAFILREWSERQVGVLCLARVAEELAFWKNNGALQPLPERSLLYGVPADTVIAYLRRCLHEFPKEHRFSIDIETIGGKFPYTVSVAVSRNDAISFSLWDYPNDKSALIWRLLDEILRSKRQIGQNYLSFDCRKFETLGFQPSPFLCDDTMVSHHTLWAELEHKLQFQTFQYTREPYYKDEGRLWKRSDGLDKLMRYNAKDSAVTYEIFEEELRELDSRGLRDFYENVAMRRARHLYNVGKRGVRVAPDRLAALDQHLGTELQHSSETVAKFAGRPIITKAKGLPKKIVAESLNIGSPKQLIPFLESLGLRIPYNRYTGNPTTDEAALQRLFADTGHVVLAEILKVREYNKMRGTYVQAKTVNGVIFTEFVPTGTVTGRLSSRENSLGQGTNLQNIPKHSSLGLRFRECLVARPGKVFVECDQAQAEDWVVNAIIASVSGITSGLDELRRKIDRHQKLAAFIFSRPLNEITKKSIERYLGKKTRHAGNYDMHGETMSEALAKEGFMYQASACDYFLDKFHQANTEIKGVYHKWVQDQLNTTRLLRSPLGRERVFFGLRPFSNNNDQYRQGYSTIPQAVVSDNNGLAMSYIEERTSNLVLLDVHDALILEIDDDIPTVLRTVALLREAYNRPLDFGNGVVINIPIDISLGYDLKNTLECDSLDETGLTHTWNTLSQSAKVRHSTISGVPQLVLQPA